MIIINILKDETIVYTVTIIIVIWEKKNMEYEPLGKTLLLLIIQPMKSSINYNFKAQFKQEILSGMKITLMQQCLQNIKCPKKRIFAGMLLQFLRTKQ